MKKFLYLVRHLFNSIELLICSKWNGLTLYHIGRKVRIGRHCTFEGDLKTISIGDESRIDSYCVIGARNGIDSRWKGHHFLIQIGKKCIIGQYNHITAINKIVIGDNLLTGRNVLITDNSHGCFTEEELAIHPLERELKSKGEVIIGKNVWIGDKATIMPGVHIGDGCIIGANSVVTHDIPSYCVAVGNPARVIKSTTINN